LHRSFAVVSKIIQLTTTRRTAEEKENIMTAILRRTIAMGVLVLATGTGVAAQIPVIPPLADQTTPLVQEVFVTAAFDARVSEYVTLHRLLEGPLPPLRSTTNMSAVFTNMRILAQRIQRARQGAQTGDIIGPDTARMFRRIIATSLTPEEWQAYFAEIAEDAEGVPAAPPTPLRVNMEWPLEVPFDFVPPQLLLALPPLPPELQYRIVGRSLVLWDHHANLIVDFLPRAFTT
jgi:hypothetical protein